MSLVCKRRDYLVRIQVVDDRDHQLAHRSPPPIHSIGSIVGPDGRKVRAGFLLTTTAPGPPRTTQQTPLETMPDDSLNDCQEAIILVA
jgi:hypothetical protein